MGWLVSAKYLDPILLSIFGLDTHERYLNVWFSIFVSIELTILLIYIVYMYKTYKIRQRSVKRTWAR